jgi:RecB family exonuclease
MLGGTSEYLEKPLTERMEKSLGGYLKDAQRVISDPNTDNYVEKLVVCNPYLYGTADRIDVTHYKNHKMLTVSDLKTGRHVVEPKDNEQLMLYAWMFIQNTLDEYEWNDYDVVRLRIYQNKKFTTWKANVYTIESRVHELLQVVIETGVYPDKSIKMGEWCQWCPARVLCDEQSKQLKTVEQLSKEIAG